MSNKMLKTAGFMTIATLLAKVLGMFRDMLIAAYFSTSYVSDAYMTATKLPTMLFDLAIGGVITASFIPVFNGIIQKKGKDEAMSFANHFVGMVMTVSVLVAVMGILFANPLINFLAPDFDVKTHDLAAQLSSIMFPMIIFTGLAFSFVGILQSFGEFNIPSIMSLVSNLTVIAYFPIFGKKFGVHGLAVTMLIAWSLQVIIQIPALKKTGYKFRPRLDFKDLYIKEALILAGPLLISTWVSPLYSIVNTRIASGIAGGVTMLEYANRLYTVMVGVFSFVVTNLIFPRLSVSNASENYEEANELLSTSIKAILIIILPLMAGLVILGRPVISVVYEHGSFTTDDAIKTGTALSCYCVGMIGFSLNEMLSKAFFSKKNSKTPMYNAIASMLINIMLAYLLSARFGIYGLAFATACGSTANALLNYIAMRIKYGKIFKKSDIISIVKTVTSAVVMSIAVILIYYRLSQLISHSVGGNLIICAVCGAVGVIVYFALCLILGVDEIKKIAKRG
ncbi:MAG: murein biosynthesis integral membrane protein MurJ [Clostridia bacterium]|nr:murein biosynthesis integral membrane protein MurJ [Clostridia bacterium]